MSHHDHDHAHDHHHDNDDHGHHDHKHNDTGGIPFVEKLEKMLAHWIRHNSDHVGTYRDWAGRAKNEGMPEIAELILKAADASDSLNELFEKAAARLKEVL
ncbi:MAG: hypothetical protein GXP53_12170 [Deltaproteobacteria bacterium]|nr:hypothetical protein [Deltaproteobacteria bacterium]